MQALERALKSCHLRILQQLHVAEMKKLFSQSGRKAIADDAMLNKSPTVQQKGLDNTTVGEILMRKGEEKVGSWLWCSTNDTVYDAVRKMAQNNIGSLVVLKPGHEQMIAGIITERDYLRKVIVKERSSKNTQVREIMTEQEKLITVRSNTNIFNAMQVMTENQIRHVPVIDGRIVGMVSIVDVVRAVVEQQSGELKRLNEFIKGDYY